MNENKYELMQLIQQVAEHFCNKERISAERRVLAFQPREFIMQLDSYERDACLEIRNEVTRLVDVAIKENFEYSDEEAKRWRRETFGPMAEMELSECIEQAYREYSNEYRHIQEIYRSKGRR